MPISGIPQRTLSAAQVLAAVTSDSVKWKGVDIYKKRPVFIWGIPEGYKELVGTWVTGDEAQDWMGQYLNNNATAAQNDGMAFTKPFLVPVSGEYTAAILSYGNSNRGEAHVFINGVDKGTLDLYAAGDTKNHLVTVSLGTLTAGIKAINLIASDKNASSSGYVLYFSALVIYKT